MQMRLPRMDNVRRKIKVQDTDHTRNFAVLVTLGKVKQDRGLETAADVQKVCH